ncbi:phospholipase, patatin family [Staphylococcus caprae M23864:W1]|uniref:patatin-like phospholipase family protein n=1 Tax=Staphylococcus caprae TaxID=29380 RepID=UPI0001AAC4F9|nr:patatin-like phospholipase family protein [Staphylococcus caprae]EES41214.1 phospholipase, patatin family [Staphylococcus caprae M23864:W1]MDI0015269.1 patatin-like phospholipase family protein [Staphylococcus caprae]
MENDKALVLGGGGITGMAWEAGVLAGLNDSNIDVSTADAIIGTSAGSFIGTVLANQEDMKSYYLELPSQISSDDRGAMSSDLYRLWQNAFVVGKDDPVKVGQMLGDIIYTHPSKLPLDKRMHAIRQRLGNVEWTDNLIITAINAKSGQLATFNKQSHIALEEAVGASGAVPGLWPHIRVLEQDWIDGGMTSPANAMIAKDFKNIMIIAPLADGYGNLPSVKDDAKVLDENSSVITITPNSESQNAIGENIYSPDNIIDIGHAGYEQGMQVAKEIRQHHPAWIE